MTISPIKPTFGEKYRITGEFKKFRTDVEHGFGGRTPFHTDWYAIAFKEHKEAVYIGYRTVHEGFTCMDGDPDVDGSWEFTRKRSIKVFVFAINERSKPIYVLPSQVWDLIPF